MCETVKISCVTNCVIEEGEAEEDEEEEEDEDNIQTEIMETTTRHSRTLLRGTKETTRLHNSGMGLSL